MSKNDWIILGVTFAVGLFIAIGVMLVLTGIGDTTGQAQESTGTPARDDFNGGYGDTTTLAESDDPLDTRVCRYMHYRWLHYQKADGMHLPDRHDPLVMQDAADYFGISETDAKDRFWRAPYVDYTELDLAEFETEFPTHE